MAKLSRWLFLILALFLLLLLPTKTAFATGAGGSGTGGSSEGTENLSDGASETKTGYIIYASDADGNPTSPVVARTTYRNT